MLRTWESKQNLGISINNYYCYAGERARLTLKTNPRLKIIRNQSIIFPYQYYVVYTSVTYVGEYGRIHRRSYVINLAMYEIKTNSSKINNNTTLQ